MARVLTTLPLAAALVLLPGSARATDDPKELIVQAIKAHGGEVALAKYWVGQMTNKGKIVVPNVESECL